MSEHEEEKNGQEGDVPSDYHCPSCWVTFNVIWTNLLYSGDGFAKYCPSCGTDLLAVSDKSATGGKNRTTLLNKKRDDLTSREHCVGSVGIIKALYLPDDHEVGKELLMQEIADKWERLLTEILLRLRDLCAFKEEANK